mmetsp:Transcript_50315/g.121030  ORF Transcript_50315/g.121030 Transcript_50315/m.121030 type:complete len:245 (+) Transcript_50315:273-1007(+)
MLDLVPLGRDQAEAALVRAALELDLPPALLQQQLERRALLELLDEVGLVRRRQRPHVARLDPILPLGAVVLLEGLVAQPQLDVGARLPRLQHPRRVPRAEEAVLRAAHLDDVAHRKVLQHPLRLARRRLLLDLLGARRELALLPLGRAALAVVGLRPPLRSLLQAPAAVLLPRRMPPPARPQRWRHHRAVRVAKLDRLEHEASLAHRLHASAATAALAALRLRLAVIYLLDAHLPPALLVPRLR